MNRIEMREIAKSIDLENAYDMVQIVLERIVEEETANGNFKQIVKCMTETQFCQLICDHPIVNNALQIDLMRRIYRAINHCYNNQLAAIVQHCPITAPLESVNVQQQRLN